MAGARRCSGGYSREIADGLKRAGEPVTTRVSSARGNSGEALQTSRPDGFIEEGRADARQCHKRLDDVR